MRCKAHIRGQIRAVSSHRTRKLLRAPSVDALPWIKRPNAHIRRLIFVCAQRLGEPIMKEQLEAIIQRLEVARQHVTEMKEKHAADSEKAETIEDVELALEWAL